MAENQFDHKLKVLQSDWDGEFQSFVTSLTTHGREERKHLLERNW